MRNWPSAAQRWWDERSDGERAELVEALWRDEVLPAAYAPSLVGAGVDVYGYAAGGRAPLPAGYPFPDALVGVVDAHAAA